MKGTNDPASIDWMHSGVYSNQSLPYLADSANTSFASANIRKGMYLLCTKPYCIRACLAYEARKLSCIQKQY